MCGNEIWLGCFFIVRCMDMRLLIEYHFLRALLVRSQVPKWMLYLLYFPSYSGWDPILSWLFSARKRRTYFIFYGIFLWKLYLRAACTRDFFSRFQCPYFQFSVSLQLALLRLFAAVILFSTGSLFLLLLFWCKLVQFWWDFYAAVQLIRRVPGIRKLFEYVDCVSQRQNFSWLSRKQTLVQILVAVANIQMRTLKTEVEKGSMWLVIRHGWVDPKR